MSATKWRAPSHEIASMTLTMFTLNAFYGLALAMNMFIIASCLNLIFGVLRVINFAHGMVYMFGAYIPFTVASGWVPPFFVAVRAAARPPRPRPHSPHPPTAPVWPRRPTATRWHLPCPGPSQ